MKTAVLLILVLAIGVATAIQFDVVANQERCFFEEYGTETLVVGEYHVLPGEFMNVEISVRERV
jgi:hypothetical protein